MRFLGPPQLARMQRDPDNLEMISADVYRVPGDLLASWGSRSSQEPPVRLRKAQGGPRSSSEMSSASFRKIGFFGPGRRLAPSGAPKIGGGASLARRDGSRAPASFEFLSFSLLRHRGPTPSNSFKIQDIYLSVSSSSCFDILRDCFTKIGLFMLAYN